MPTEVSPQKFRGRSPIARRGVLSPWGNPLGEKRGLLPTPTPLAYGPRAPYTPSGGVCHRLFRLGPVASALPPSPPAHDRLGAGGLQLTCPAPLPCRVAWEFPPRVPRRLQAAWSSDGTDRRGSLGDGLVLIGSGFQQSTPRHCTPAPACVCARSEDG
jgi:hypothetical protein